MTKLEDIRQQLEQNIEQLEQSRLDLLKRNSSISPEQWRTMLRMGAVVFALIGWMIVVIAVAPFGFIAIMLALSLVVPMVYFLAKYASKEDPAQTYKEQAEAHRLHIFYDDFNKLLWEPLIEQTYPELLYHNNEIPRFRFEFEPSRFEKLLGSYELHSFFDGNIEQTPISVAVVNTGKRGAKFKGFFFRLEQSQTLPEEITWILPVSFGGPKLTYREVSKVEGTWDLDEDYEIYTTKNIAAFDVLNEGLIDRIHELLDEGDDLVLTFTDNSLFVAKWQAQVPLTVDLRQSFIESDLLGRLYGELHVFQQVVQLIQPQNNNEGLSSRG